jgi:hypothetical protein
MIDMGPSLPSSRQPRVPWVSARPPWASIAPSSMSFRRADLLIAAVLIALSGGVRLRSSAGCRASSAAALSRVARRRPGSAPRQRPPGSLPRDPERNLASRLLVGPRFPPGTPFGLGRSGGRPRTRGRKLSRCAESLAHGCGFAGVSMSPLPCHMPGPPCIHSTPPAGSVPLTLSWSI